jgi:hypothetical protein
MAIKVYKVADIVEKHAVLRGQRRTIGDVAAVLSNCVGADDPIPESAWTIHLVIGSGPAAHPVSFECAPILSKSDPTDFPVFFKNDKICVIYFRDRLFIAERMPMSEREREEVALRVKKAAYDEEVELSSLRSAVANLEATIEFQKVGPKRMPIPEDVKLVVWARDGGSCVRCGSRQDLHFDHIIPVSKGGGNSEANIQLLCQPCNLTKSDKIAIA